MLEHFQIKDYIEGMLTFIKLLNMKKLADKNKQNKTLQPKINPQTGLTPQQEECASLLAAGEKVSVVAEKVKVSRSTIYQWNELITFKCFLNQLRDEVKTHLNHTLLSLSGEALSVIRHSLKSENENARLKSAIWLLEKMSKEEVGACNPFSVIKEEATFPDIWQIDDITPVFHKNVYEKKLKELGLKETDEIKISRIEEIDENFGWGIPID